jgi:hypothetical protein
LHKHAGTQCMQAHVTSYHNCNSAELQNAPSLQPLLQQRTGQATVSTTSRSTHPPHPVAVPAALRVSVRGLVQKTTVIAT